MVSEKHSGFVINYNDATASDVIELCRQVREKVKALSGVELEMEVKGWENSNETCDRNRNERGRKDHCLKMLEDIGFTVWTTCQSLWWINLYSLYQKVPVLKKQL